MEIRVARSAGFCYGVRRAVELTESLNSEGGDRRVVTLGPLIHNPQELARLESLGVKAVDDSDVDEADLVVVRSHGITADQHRMLEARSAGGVQDATCPYVKSCQVQARRLARAGYGVVIVGDSGHPETESVRSHALEGAAEAERTQPVTVVSGPEGLDQVEAASASRVAVLAQTTMELDRFRDVVAGCLERFVEVRAFNTICEATQERQLEALELAREADRVVVVGGHTSANTCRLAAVCAAVQPRTLHVEAPDELEQAWLQGAARVAVTAGASTPDRIIQDVVSRIEELSGD